MSFINSVWPKIRVSGRVLGPKIGLASKHSSSNHVRYRFASTYKAALVNEFKQPLVIGEVKRKALKPEEVRIGVYACGINSVDVSNINGELEPKPSLPFIPGYEAT